MVGVLEDCLEFISTVGPNVSLFRTGSAATPVDARIQGAVLAAAQSPGHHLLVGADVLRSDIGDPIARAEHEQRLERLRTYVHSVTSKGIDLVVDLVDSATMGLVTDPDALRAAHEQLGVAVGAGGTDRLVPAAILHRQDSLRSLATTADDPPMSRLTSYLSGLQGPQTDVGTTLGALIALNGELPGRSTDELAASNAPMARPTAQQALGAGFAKFDLSGLESAVTNGARALVHGWMPGASVPQTFLYFSDGGTNYFVDPSKGPQGALTAVDLESGGGDARLILEQPSTEVMLLDANNEPLPVPARPALSVRDRENPGVTKVGSWSAPTRMGKGLLDMANSLGDNAILLQPRRGPRMNGQPTLDEQVKIELTEAIRRIPNPVILSTEPNEDLNAFATVQHDAKVWAPRNTGFDSVEWELVSPGGVSRDRYFELTPDLVNRVLRAEVAKEPLPPILEALLKSDSWRAVEELMDANRAAISTPENAAALAKMVDSANVKAAQPNPLGPGTIGEASFYLPDRTLPALSVMVKIDTRALTDPDLAGRPSMEPMTPFVTEEIAPSGTRFDAKTILGYFTNRAMSLPADQRLQFDMAVVRLRDMFRPMITAEYGRITEQDLRVLLGAKGMFASERAERSPGAPELDLGHAKVAEVIGDIYTKGLGSVDPAVMRELVDAIDCFTGNVRVAYHYLFELVMNPARPDLAPEANKVANAISLCH